MFKNPFTATKLQVVTYLFGVALFSISFLVYLNASVSFVITDLIGKSKGVGNAVGSLGFADELVALVACPIWGLLSDKLGVRAVCVMGYTIVGISLFVFVQARNVYPQLLLARIFFSIGGAATSTMVTAVLPTMTSSRHGTPKRTDPNSADRTSSSHSANAPSTSTSRSTTSGSTSATITPARYANTNDTHLQPSPQHATPHTSPPRSSNTSLIAGLVGTFTGLGALLALGIFLPLPTYFSAIGSSRPASIRDAFYTVGSIALLISILCFIGLRHLPGEEGKGLHLLLGGASKASTSPIATPAPRALSLFAEALRLGVSDLNIGLGYLGGFVARASSVGISLFIPLFVNAYFIRSGLCPVEGTPRDPSDVKQNCHKAYTLAAALSGVSQVVALCAAPVFGYVDGKIGREWNTPLLSAAVAGVVGYGLLGGLERPDRGGVVWGCMVLVGLSQIGAIVCSLALLGRGIEGGGDEDRDGGVEGVQGDGVRTGHEEDGGGPGEREALIPGPRYGRGEDNGKTRAHLKGTIAGLYSLSGGAGILLLTKLGGYLFDKTSPGAPFFMLAVFNGILLAIGLACNTVKAVRMKRQADAMS